MSHYIHVFVHANNPVLLPAKKWVDKLLSNILRGWEYIIHKLSMCSIGFELDRIHLTLIRVTALMLPTIMACCHGFVLLTSATLINLKYLYPRTGQVQQPCGNQLINAPMWTVRSFGVGIFIVVLQWLDVIVLVTLFQCSLCLRFTILEIILVNGCTHLCVDF